MATGESWKNAALILAAGWKLLYDEATGAVVRNGTVVDFLWMTVGLVPQGYPLYLLLFNIFPQKTMQKALTILRLFYRWCSRRCRRNWHPMVVSVHLWTTALQLPVCWRHGLPGSSEELQQLEYGMEISSDKSKILVNSIKPRPFTNTWMIGKVMKEVDQTKDGTSKWKQTSDWHRNTRPWQS